ncbi:hypothetical protein Tco_1568411 [Tanacetum coccineum]
MLSPESTNAQSFSLDRIESDNDIDGVEVRILIFECARSTPTANLPYGMFLTGLHRDHGKACHSISSTSAHHNYGSSSHQRDDDEDDGASRASTPSRTTYLNSLQLLNYQRYDIPTFSQQDDDLLFERQIDLLN